MPSFPTRTGRRLSREAVQGLVAKHAAAAATRCPTLSAKNVDPDVLRHSCAMPLLHAQVETPVIALWLCYAAVRSSRTYLHADITINERALAPMVSTTAASGATGLRQTLPVPRSPVAMPIGPCVGRRSDPFR